MKKLLCVVLTVVCVMISAQAWAAPFKGEVLEASRTTDQLIVVTGTGGSNASFVMYEKDGNGDWKQVISTKAYIGKKGLGKTKEGDMKTPTGDEIPIEMRDGAEIRSMWYTEPMVCEGVELYNPAFDVTDHTLLTGIITEKGLCRAPYEEAFRSLDI